MERPRPVVAPLSGRGVEEEEQEEEEKLSQGDQNQSH